MLLSAFALDLGDFNPRTRVGCDCCPPSARADGRDFNPRTRVGCDAFKRALTPFKFISIHAPAWGATLLHLHCIKNKDISIHAPAWGATAEVPCF